MSGLNALTSPIFSPGANGSSITANDSLFSSSIELPTIDLVGITLQPIAPARSLCGIVSIVQFSNFTSPER